MEEDGAGERRGVHQPALRAAQRRRRAPARKPTKAGEQRQRRRASRARTRKTTAAGDAAERQRGRRRPAAARGEQRDVAPQRGEIDKAEGEAGGRHRRRAGPRSAMSGRSFAVHPLPGEACSRARGRRRAGPASRRSRCRNAGRASGRRRCRQGSASTMVQPSAPIIARFWPIERSPSRCQRVAPLAPRLDRVVEAARGSRRSASWLEPVVGMLPRRAGQRRRAFGPEEAADLADRREIEPLRVGARRLLLLELGAGSVASTSVSSWCRSSPATASARRDRDRVAAAHFEHAAAHRQMVLARRAGRASSPPRRRAP